MKYIQTVGHYFIAADAGQFHVIGIGGVYLAGPYDSFNDSVSVAKAMQGNDDVD